MLDNILTTLQNIFLTIKLKHSECIISTKIYKSCIDQLFSNYKDAWPFYKNYIFLRLKYKYLHRLFYHKYFLIIYFYLKEQLLLKTSIKLSNQNNIRIK